MTTREYLVAHKESFALQTEQLESSIQQVFYWNVLKKFEANICVSRERGRVSRGDI